MAQSFTLRTRRSRFRSLCLVTLFLSIWTSLTAAACYSRNGTLITSKAYQPCSKDTTRDSVCCGINHSGAGDTGVANDICETNGLCQNWEGKVGNEQPDKIWWRQGCTDPTWESPYCLKDVCNFDLWKNDNAPVRSCANGKWCCGEKNCCNISSSLFTLAATVGPTSTPISTPTISSTATSTSNAQSSTKSSHSLVSDNVPSPTNIDQSASNGSKSSLSSGAKIGIGVAVPLVFILLAIIGFLLFKLKKRKENGKLLPTELNAGSENEKRPNVVYAHNAEQAPIALAELDAGAIPVESGGQPRAELPGMEANPFISNDEVAESTKRSITNAYA